jgi:HEPN domain-containing protein
MADRPRKARAQDCTRENALSRLQQAESFVEVAELVITGGDNDIATPGVAAALAALAGIAASDAACCAKLKMRPRGRDHKEAVPMLATVHPHGPQMAKDLERLLNRKDDAHYGLHLIGKGDAEKMVEWAKRIVGNARKVLESG